MIKRLYPCTSTFEALKNGRLEDGSILGRIGCTHCGESFDTVRELEYHLMKEHEVIPPPRFVESEEAAKVVDRLGIVEVLHYAGSPDPDFPSWPKTFLRCAGCRETVRFFDSRQAGRDFNEFAERHEACKKKFAGRLSFAEGEDGGLSLALEGELSEVP
jgi:hypothetical protein